MSQKNIEAIYPLSPVQQAMLFHTLAEPESAAYFSQLNCVLRGDLAVSAFGRAWQKVLDRHAILRSAFIWEGVQQPLQVVGRKVKLTLQEHDWSHLTPAEQQERLETYLREDQKRGFKLSKAPLLRLALFKLSPDEHRLVWSLHHLLLDGWSWPIVIQETLAFYESLRRNEELHLPASRPYGDYIEWLLKQDTSRAEAFWRRSLKGLTAPTQLNLPNPSGGLPDPDRIYLDQRRTLPADLMSQLQSIAKRYQLTINTLVQGAWALLLSRYSGERDVVFGVTSSGRPADLKGVEHIVGVFINTLPVRVRVAPEQSVGLWLKQFQSRQVEMREYEFSPLTQVHGWSDIPRTSPLFECIFVFQNYPVDSSKPKGGQGLDISVTTAIENTNFPVTVVATAASELAIKIVYDSRLFDSAAVARIFGHMHSLLAGIVADTQRPISSLDLLSDDERRQILTDWNGAAREFPDDKRFHHLFARQAALTPDAVAVDADGEQLSYQELNVRANRLARYLRLKGVGADGLVGIFMERGLDMAVAIIAVFKAGAAYAPLDPFYPKDRLAYLLADTQAHAALSHQKLIEKLPDCDAPVICLDASAEAIAGQSEADVAVECGPGNMAYVIYTSGSTGAPKGAMIEHCGMLNHLYAKICDLQLTAADVVAQTASQCFDISVWQFLAALIVGGRVKIFSNEVAHSPSRLLAKIEQEGVTIWETVPSLLRGALEEARGSQIPYRLSSLRWLLVTGEALGPDLCRDWLKAYPTPPLLNAYGPTECSDDVTHFTILSPPSEAVVHTPIGRPIMNMRAYILDEHLLPAPVGVRGELYIGGIGVGRGYLNDAYRTAEAFIPDLFAAARGARLYKTGDVARYRSDGAIEFLGRADHQIKVRGFRIEPGEIELALSHHPAVEQSLVLAAEGAPGDKRLVAYIVPKAGMAPEGADLKRLLKEKLPDYMIPSAFVMLDTMPKTSNGKVDRQALPAPDPNLMRRQAVFVAPQTDIEKVQARIWAEVLKVEAVGVEDNFFDLGGHSLAATQLISRLRMAFGVDLTLADFFASATVKDTSDRIEALLISRASPGELDELISELESLDEEEAAKRM
jgi:surfactin family lipopeptide synthetase C